MTASSNLSSAVAIAAPYALPKESGPREISWGLEGPVWFTEYNTSKLGEISSTGALSERTLPAGSGPTGISYMGDDMVWTDTSSSKIGVIAPSGEITEPSLPAGSEPIAIATGYEDDAWFSDQGTNKVGRISGEGTINGEYSLSAYPGKPGSLVVDYNKDIWVTHRDPGANSIIELNSSGTVLANVPVAGEPQGIAIQENFEEHNVWVTVDDGSAPKLDRIVKSTRALTEFAMPAGTGTPHELTDHRNEMWYTSYGTNGASILGHSTSAGVMTNETLPEETGGDLSGITEGPAGQLWFTSELGNKIYEVARRTPGRRSR